MRGYIPLSRKLSLITLLEALPRAFDTRYRVASFTTRLIHGSLSWSPVIGLLVIVITNAYRRAVGYCFSLSLSYYVKIVACLELSYPTTSFPWEWSATSETLIYEITRRVKERDIKRVLVALFNNYRDCYYTLCFSRILVRAWVINQNK